ncbi:MAG: hypothetical protein NTW59_03410 [Candidatus Diapherotrites archaeon]|nr:hypothetical protein [Candidatus Diapherotrites archaeon]
MLPLLQDPLTDNLVTVLSLFYLIWIYSWAKKQLGSAKLAILFAVIVVYLTFFQFRWLVWIPVGIFLFAVFGKGVLEKMPK